MSRALTGREENAARPIALKPSRKVRRRAFIERALRKYAAFAERGPLNRHNLPNVALPAPAPGRGHHAQTRCRQVFRHRLVEAALGQQALGQRRQAAPGRIPGGIDQPVQRKFEHPGIDDRDIDVITQPAHPCRRQCRLRPGQRGGAHELQGVGMAAQQIPGCRRIEQEAGVERQSARRGDEADAEMIPLVVQRLDLEVQDMERDRLAHPQGAPAGDGVVVDLQFGTLPGILAARIGHDEDQRPQLLNQRGIRRPGRQAPQGVRGSVRPAAAAAGQGCRVRRRLRLSIPAGPERVTPATKGEGGAAPRLLECRIRICPDKRCLSAPMPAVIAGRMPGDTPGP